MTFLTNSSEPSAQREPSSTHQGAVGVSLSFEAVFRSHSSQVSRTLMSLGVQPAYVDDAVQDVFLIVHQKLKDFEGRSKLSTWIYAVTYRVASNYRRHLKLRTHEELGEESGAKNANPENHLATSEATRFVQEFCATLPEIKRDIFVLSVLEERSSPEVAEVLKLNLNTVYSRLRAVRAEFRSALSRVQVAVSGKQVEKRS